jgi:hypothetical protein
MPNWKLPIQRASSTWLASASTALATKHQEDFAGEQLRQPVVAFVGENGFDAREEARRRWRRRCGISRTDQRHGFSLRRLRRSASDGKAMLFLSKEALRIGSEELFVQPNQGVLSLATSAKMAATASRSLAVSGACGGSGSPTA